MRLAGDKTDALERRHLPCDAGRRDAEPLSELRAAELPVVCPAQLAQEREIRDRDPMQRERMVELAREHCAQHGEVEEGVEARHRDITSTTQRDVKVLVSRVSGGRAG